MKLQTLKEKQMKTQNEISFTRINFLLATSALLVLSLLPGCSNKDPIKEDVPELITQVTLTFTPVTGGTTVTTTATDPDGEGVQNIQMDGPINLAASTTYVMDIQLVNGLAEPGSKEYDVTSEVQEEGDEHQFFFSWTNNLFAEPSGNGNIDHRADPLNYTGGTYSLDDNGRPLGLNTTWTTSGSAGSGDFRVLLKHQPDLKSDTSDSTMGETDLDVTFTINVQ